MKTASFLFALTFVFILDLLFLAASGLLLFVPTLFLFEEGKWPLTVNFYERHYPFYGRSKK